MSEATVSLTAVDGGLVIDGTTAFSDNYEYLSAELSWLDLLITRGVRNMRAAAPARAEVYVSDAEVDHLLSGESSQRDATLDATLDSWRSDIDEAARLSGLIGVRLPLPELAERRDLSQLERLALLICLAPELDRKYDRLYAYLQDDITRKRPSVDLIVGLIEQTTPDRWRALRQLSPQAPLFRQGMLRVVVDSYSPSGSTALAQLVQLNPRFISHLLGDDDLDPALAGRARMITPTPGPSPGDLAGAMEAELADLAARSNGAMVIQLAGGHGVGRTELARAVTARLGRPLLELDLVDPDRGAADSTLHTTVEAGLREAWLMDAAVLIANGDLVPSSEQIAFHSAVDARLAEHPCLVFVTSDQPWHPERPLRHAALHEVVLPRPDAETRRAAWAAALADSGLHPPDGLIGRFRLSPGQINDVVDGLRRVTNGRTPERTEWFAACRRASEGKLSTLATKLTSPHRPDELLLAAEQIEQLNALRDQVRYRDQVLDDWGLGTRFSGSRGLAALFSGPPGTGKTMAAGVLAGELGVDLYRVDLSRVVSKYIGETEKNLAGIFDAAETSNAVLFFDEADALFGKRTKVSDSHDRYANIETSYLLQRMEEHDGIVILATNIQQNMDDAFMRRLRFVIQFPFPDREQRQLIWRMHLQTGAPLDESVDDDALALLADRLPLSGGSIRNVALSAAFLAAAEDRALGIDQLLAAARMEFAKTGALWPDPKLGDPAGTGGRR